VLGGQEFASDYGVTGMRSVAEGVDGRHLQRA